MTPRFYLIIVFMLSGCATYHPQPVSPAALMNDFEARSLDNPELRLYIAAHCGSPGACAPGIWNLNTLTLAAFYFSPTLDVARAKQGTRVAAIQTAGQYPNPALQLPLGYTSNAIPGQSPYTYGLGLDIPIETARKRGYRMAQARQLANAARFNIGNAAWQVRSRLRGHMLNLYAASRRAQLLERQIVTQQQIAAMLDKRLAVGEASAPEDSQAHIALARNQLDLVRTRQQSQDERAQIAATIGVPVAALAQIKMDFGTFERVYPAIPDDEARRQAVLNRADVLAALSEYEASQAALQLEISRQYPDIHIGPGYTFDAGAHKFLLPVSGITLPLFNQNQGQIAEASAHRKEMAARVNAVQAQAINDTDRAVQNYRTALAGLHLAEALLSAQRLQAQDLQKTYQAGATDRLTLALGQHVLYVQELADQAALVQVQQDIGQLEDALQRPLSATDFPAIPNTGDLK